MKELPRSDSRAVTVHDRARGAVASLRAVRDELVALLERVDAAIGDAEKIVEYVAGVADFVGELGVDASEAQARNRLRAYGKAGETVIGVVEKTNVPVRLVLGPGAPATPAAAEARGAAIDTLHDGGLSAADIARVLGVSFEAARRRVATRKAAA